MISSFEAQHADAYDGHQLPLRRRLRGANAGIQAAGREPTGDVGLRRLFIFVLAPAMAGLILFVGQLLIEKVTNPDHLAVEAVTYYPGFIIPEDLVVLLASPPPPVLPSGESGPIDARISVQDKNAAGRDLALFPSARPEVINGQMSLMLLSIQNTGSGPITNLDLEIHNQDENGNNYEIFSMYSGSFPRNDWRNVNLTLEDGIGKMRYELLNTNDMHFIWLLVDSHGDLRVLIRRP